METRMYVNGTRPTIIWDMDGTMFDWASRLTELLLERDPNFPIVPEGSRVGFDYFWVEGADRDVIMSALNDPRLYLDLELIPGVIDTMLEMEAEGFDQLICSTPTYSNPGCIPGKLQDIRTHLDDRWVNRLILAHDKTVVRGDILIDDKPVITGCHTPTWQHLMRDQDYNRYIDTEHRLVDSRDWRTAVAPLLGLPVPA